MPRFEVCVRRERLTATSASVFVEADSFEDAERRARGMVGACAVRFPEYRLVSLKTKVEFVAAARDEPEGACPLGCRDAEHCQGGDDRGVCRHPAREPEKATVSEP